MKESIDELKKECKARLHDWNKIKSKKTKAMLVLVVLGVIALKVFTTVLTFDWLSDMFSTM